MTETPIKINKNQAEHRQKIEEIKADLKKYTKLKKTARRWWVVLVVLLAIIGSLAAYIVYKPIPKEAVYSQYLPQEPILYSIINKDKLYGQILLSHGAISNQFSYYGWIMNRAKEHIANAGFDFNTDIMALFQEQAGLAIFESNENSSYPFILILEKKAASAQINRVLNQLTAEFKKDFHSSEELYRQNNIVSMKSLYSSSLVIHHTQVKDYFIISNSADILEHTIDLMIDN